LSGGRGILAASAALTLVAAVGLAIGAVSANAAPVVPNLDPQDASNIVQVAAGCGPGFHPVPGHWSRWRGGWVPPHCVPNWRGAYGGGYYGRGYYGGGYPYWRNRYGY
jgi:hypothetical protein